MKGLIWVGKEREGLLVGKWTLFIASPKVTYKMIKNIFKYSPNPRIQQIYFGAGDCTPLNENVIKQCILYCKKMNIIITAEIPLEKLNTYSINLLRKINVITTVKHKNIMVLNGLYNTKNLNQIKLVYTKKNPGLYVASLHDFGKADMSKLHGNKYIGDRVLQ